MDFYYNQHGRVVGPIPLSQLAGHPINPDTLVWTDGMADWLPASQVAYLDPIIGMQPQPAAAPMAVSQLAARPAPPPIPTLEEATVNNHSGMAVCAIVCGVICLAMGFIETMMGMSSLGGIVGLVLGIVAYRKSTQSKECRIARDLRQSLSLANQARTMSVVAFVIEGAALLIGIANWVSWQRLISSY